MQVFNWGGSWAVKQVSRHWKRYFILSYMYLIFSLSSLSIEVKKFHIRLLGDIVHMNYNLLEKIALTLSKNGAQMICKLCRWKCWNTGKSPVQLFFPLIYLFFHNRESMFLITSTNFAEMKVILLVHSSIS